MKFSFVIPALNEAANIGACLQSILDETLGNEECDDGEIIVVDNGSADDTARIARSYGADIIYELRRGPNRARQTGFEYSTGELVAFIDADCRLPRGWLDTVLAQFKPGVSCVAGPYTYNGPLWFRAGARVCFWTAGGLNSLGIPIIMGGNYVVRRSALKQAGGHDTQIEFYGDDRDTAVRLSKVGRIRFTRKISVDSSNRRFLNEGYLRTVWNYWTIGLGLWKGRKSHGTQVRR